MSDQITAARQSLSLIRDSTGQITSYEYRAQALEAFGDDPDVHDLTRATSLVYYAIKTTKPSDVQRFLEVHTFLLDGRHQVFSLVIRQYEGDIPPWLEASIPHQ